MFTHQFGLVSTFAADLYEQDCKFSSGKNLMEKRRYTYIINDDATWDVKKSLMCSLQLWPKIASPTVER